MLTVRGNKVWGRLAREMPRRWGPPAPDQKPSCANDIGEENHRRRAGSSETTAVRSPWRTMKRSNWTMKRSDWTMNRRDGRRFSVTDDDSP
jgi:hypothetical protein